MEVIVFYYALTFIFSFKARNGCLGKAKPTLSLLASLIAILLRPVACFCRDPLGKSGLQWLSWEGTECPRRATSFFDLTRPSTVGAGVKGKIPYSMTGEELGFWTLNSWGSNPLFFFSNPSRLPMNLVPLGCLTCQVQLTTVPNSQGRCEA